MKTYAFLLNVIVSFLFASCEQGKKGEIVFKFESPTERDDAIVRRKSNQDSSKNRIMVRFLSGFLKDTAKICISNKCDQYYNLETNESIAYASSVAVEPVEKAKKFVLTLRGLVYSIPIEKSYRFVDLDIDLNNVLTVTYSNNVLLLSKIYLFPGTEECSSKEKTG